MRCKTRKMLTALLQGCDIISRLWTFDCLCLTLCLCVSLSCVRSGWMPWACCGWRCLTQELASSRLIETWSSDSSRSSTETSCKAEVGYNNSLLHEVHTLYSFATGGSGLGLWISRRIVHMHKVTVSFYHSMEYCSKSLLICRGISGSSLQG